MLPGASFEYIVKVIKLSYSITKASNYRIATNHAYYKDKLEMRKSIYDPNYFYNSDLFNFVGMQTNDILILANNNFTSIKENAIKLPKIIMKDRKYFISL